MSAEDWEDGWDGGLGLAPIKREGTFVDYQSGRRTAPVCYKHRAYKGLKKPRAKCAACAEVFAYRSLTTVAVKFLDSHQGYIAGKVYTYLVKREHGFALGDEAVVDTQRGPALVMVIRIDPERRDTGLFTYRQIRGRVTPL